MWWRRGERPRGIADKRFTFASIFAAIEPGADNAFALVLPYVSTEAMQLFLDRFSATVEEDEHVAMVLDQAGWHGAKALAVPSNITFMPLPPYSPDFNPLEKVWSKVKALLRKAAARTTEALWEAIGRALEEVTAKDCQGCFEFCGYHATAV